MINRLSQGMRWLGLALACLFIIAGLYLLLLVLAPQAQLPIGHNPIELNREDDAGDGRDRIQIEKINLEVPFAAGGPEVLDHGAWHRFPDRGDPKKGGNFILSAHRFAIGVTPEETRVRSPFYQIDRLEVGDAIRIYFAGEWFDYQVERTYSVTPNQTEIESASSSAKLTLYTCTLSGSADGRVVIEARRV